MPANAINVTLKDNASADQLEKAKKEVTSQGGKVTHEFKLTKGFSAEFPSGTAHSLSSNEHIEVEADSEVKTQ